jgi:hypothetical protein
MWKLVVDAAMQSRRTLQGMVSLGGHMLKSNLPLVHPPQPACTELQLQQVYNLACKSSTDCADSLVNPSSSNHSFSIQVYKSNIAGANYGVFLQVGLVREKTASECLID